MIDKGILLIIHKYCKQLLYSAIDARSLSRYTYDVNPKRDYPQGNNDYMKHIATKPYEYKVVLIGEWGSGKTCLLLSYQTNAFPTDYCPTVADYFVGRVMVNDGPIAMALHDNTATKGHIMPDSSKLRLLGYVQTDALMICMSVFDETKNKESCYKEDKSLMWSDSCVNTMAFCQEAQALCPHIKRILVGTKIDLRKDEQFRDKCYTKEEMEMFADIWGCDGYAECSALTQEGMTDTFGCVIRQIYDHRRQLLHSKSKKRCIVL